MGAFPLNLLEENMTTIAYKNHNISYDTLITTSHDNVVDKHHKLEIINGLKIFTTGALNDAFCFHAYLKEIGLKIIDPLITHKLPRKLELQCFIATRNEVYYLEVSDTVKIEPLYHAWAIGSGAKWAIAAMDHGLPSHEAVKYASKRDKSTGGSIHTESAQNQFENEVNLDLTFEVALS